MAKIVGYRIRDNYTVKINNEVSTFNDVTLHVEQRAVTVSGCPGAGKFVATYAVPLDQVSNVFQTNVKRGELVSFLDSILNKDCFLEKTLVGQNERLAGIEFIK